MDDNRGRGMANHNSAVRLAGSWSAPKYEFWRRQRRRWDALGRTMPDLFHAHSTQYYRRCEIALIKRYAGSLRGKRVLKLDLWNEAVNTRILQWMESQGAEAFGLDVSFAVTSRARRNFGERANNPHAVNADIRHLPFESDSFDFLYTMGTIEHIDEYQLATDEIFRVLREGGRAIVGVPHKWNLFLRPLLVWVLDLFGRYPYSPEKSFSSFELRRTLEKSGLNMMHRTGILTVPGIVRMADVFLFRRNISLHQLTPLFLWPFDFLETRWAWPGYFGYLIALIVEKPIAGRARDP